MSQLGCMGSEKELQRQKKGTWSLGKERQRSKGEREKHELTCRKRKNVPNNFNVLLYVGKTCMQAALLYFVNETILQFQLP